MEINRIIDLNHLLQRKDLFLVSQDPISTSQGNIHAIHWEGFLRQLWQDEIISQ